MVQGVVKRGNGPAVLGCNWGLRASSASCSALRNMPVHTQLPNHPFFRPRQYIRRIAEAHFFRPAQQARPLVGLDVVDVGCGGGILSEVSYG